MDGTSNDDDVLDYGDMLEAIVKNANQMVYGYKPNNSPLLPIDGHFGDQIFALEKMQNHARKYFIHSTVMDSIETNGSSVEEFSEKLSSQFTLEASFSCGTGGSFAVSANATFSGAIKSELKIGSSGMTSKNLSQTRTLYKIGSIKLPGNLDDGIKDDDDIWDLVKPKVKKELKDLECMKREDFYAARRIIEKYGPYFIKQAMFGASCVKLESGDHWEEKLDVSSKSSKKIDAEAGFDLVGLRSPKIQAGAAMENEHSETGGTKRSNRLVKETVYGGNAPSKDKLHLPTLAHQNPVIIHYKVLPLFALFKPDSIGRKSLERVFKTMSDSLMPGTGRADILPPPLPMADLQHDTIPPHQRDKPLFHLQNLATGMYLKTYSRERFTAYLKNADRVGKRQWFRMFHGTGSSKKVGEIEPIIEQGDNQDEGNEEIELFIIGQGDTHDEGNQWEFTDVGDAINNNAIGIRSNHKDVMINIGCPAEKSRLGLLDAKNGADEGRSKWMIHYHGWQNNFPVASFYNQETESYLRIKSVGYSKERSPYSEYPTMELTNNELDKFAKWAIVEDLEMPHCKKGKKFYLQNVVTSLYLRALDLEQRENAQDKRYFNDTKNKQWICNIDAKGFVIGQDDKQGDDCQWEFTDVGESTRPNAVGIRSTHSNRQINIDLRKEDRVPHFYGEKGSEYGSSKWIIQYHSTARGQPPIASFYNDREKGYLRIRGETKEETNAAYKPCPHLTVSKDEDMQTDGYARWKILEVSET